MSQLPQNLPLSRDQVLDEVEFLLTVEHALIVEYLSVRCALGYDLDTAHGGPVTQAGREAAAEADSQADLLMLKVGRVVRALHGVRTVTALGRAGEIADATGTEISLKPPTREQLEHLLDREEAIAAAVDARYARLVPAMHADGPDGEAFPAQLRIEVEGGHITWMGSPGCGTSSRASPSRTCCAPPAGTATRTPRKPCCRAVTARTRKCSMRWEVSSATRSVTAAGIPGSWPWRRCTALTTSTARWCVPGSCHRSRCH
jgi:hypothetical protein